jgi:hypothetical protein
MFFIGMKDPLASDAVVLNKGKPPGYYRTSGSFAPLKNSGSQDDRLGWSVVKKTSDDNPVNDDNIS